MTTPASPIDQLVVSLDQFGDFLIKLETWDLTPEQCAAVSAVLADADEAFDRGDTDAIRRAVDRLTQIDRSCRRPASGLGNQRNRSEPSVQQTPVTGLAKLSEMLPALRAKNAAAQRAAMGVSRPGDQPADTA